jgi:hypothetical protein
MYSTYIDKRQFQVNMDATPPPKSQGKCYLVEARSNFRDWVEARAPIRNDSHQVSMLLWEEIIRRYRIFARLIVDGGPENKSLLTIMAMYHDIRPTVTSIYHLEVNRPVQSGVEQLRPHSRRCAANKSGLIGLITFLLLCGPNAQQREQMQDTALVDPSI